MSELTVRLATAASLAFTVFTLGPFLALLGHPVLPEAVTTIALLASTHFAALALLSAKGHPRAQVGDRR